MEMRVLAHMCGDPTMLKLFHDAKGDIYRDLACKLFSKTADNITDVERTQAKTICLGQSFGRAILRYSLDYCVTLMSRSCVWDGE